MINTLPLSASVKDAAGVMEKMTYARLEQIMNTPPMCDYRKPYHVLIFPNCRDFGNIQINYCIIPMVEPPKMIGTMCFRLDNRNGKFEMIWCFPKDAPIREDVITTEQGSEWMKQQAERSGLPIIYG